MACNQTLAGIARDCVSALGGVEEVLIANFDEVTAITETSDVVSAITMATGKTFHRYTFRPQTAEATSTLNRSGENGTAFVTTELALQFHKQDTAKRIEVEALIHGDLRVIYKDNNGKWWLMGKERPVEATAGPGNTGRAFGDFNGYGVTLQSNESGYPTEVSESVIEGILPA